MLGKSFVSNFESDTGIQNILFVFSKLILLISSSFVGSSLACSTTGIVHTGFSSFGSFTGSISSVGIVHIGSGVILFVSGTISSLTGCFGSSLTLSLVKGVSSTFSSGFISLVNSSKRLILGLGFNFLLTVSLTLSPFNFARPIFNVFG